MTQPFIYLGQISTFPDSAEQTVVRETREKLATEIKAEQKLCTVEYDYPTFHLKMDLVFQKVVSPYL